MTRSSKAKPKDYAGQRLIQTRLPEDVYVWIEQQSALSGETVAGWLRRSLVAMRDTHGASRAIVLSDILESVQQATKSSQDLMRSAMPLDGHRLMQALETLATLCSVTQSLVKHVMMDR